MDPTAGVYAFSKVPPNARWGTQPHNDSYLVDDRDMVCSLLGLMRVEMAFFQTRGGTYAERVAIKGDTIFEDDARAVNALLARANSVVPPNGSCHCKTVLL